ncbi:MAG: type II toxin-antitoxin system VapC family toxin [Pseudomonadota bacterium]|nr:type II toxin-antitoxin system VapC family toxin [Pseudomonadota bacterium]MDE3037622.1 type II toxin-antitoxin system VapC family toxin [Pseudomonadota bacterium]
MILADTSVWADHLRRNDAMLAALLDAKQIMMHTFVIGELAMEDLRPRQAILGSLRALPHADPVDYEEALVFIEEHRLFGSGIGYVDAHLLASARLSSARLWTRDKRLNKAAIRLGLAYRPH